MTSHFVFKLSTLLWLIVLIFHTCSFYSASHHVKCHHVCLSMLSVGNAMPLA